MICDVCRKEIKKGKHVILDPSPKPLIHICKTCIVHALQADDHATVAYGGIIELPELVFAHKDNGTNIIGEKPFCDIAVECGWSLSPTTDNYKCIFEHYFQSINQRWWAGIGEWIFNGALTPIECFRKSCVNIKQNYSVWERNAK